MLRCQETGEPCVGPKHRMARLQMETTMAVLGQRGRSLDEDWIDPSSVSVDQR